MKKDLTPDRFPGIRFASRDSVRAASSWMITRYAKTFNRLAKTQPTPPNTSQGKEG